MLISCKNVNHIDASALVIMEPSKLKLTAKNIWFNFLSSKDILKLLFLEDNYDRECCLTILWLIKLLKCVFVATNIMP